jgi:hypothetical protein
LASFINAVLDDAARPYTDCSKGIPIPDYPIA